ncbi:Dihydrofolate synthetase [Leucoagaricus sp. SymC.cos]|nr:Dihydrofolate synthetase [Leucoagaricus sp. SymC.cos]
MSIDLSLDRLQRAVPHLPKYTRPTCHIAGTNGKGSVTAIISSIFRSTSPPLNVGRYNSPHLTSIYDSIVINDDPVDAKLYGSVRFAVERVDQELGTKLSSFELLTLTALQIFERTGVDVAVIEVGMGGRLDATNVIPDEAILVSALTNVDLDHQAFLGSTVSAIAREKAGIARPQKPFVLGPQRYQDVIAVVKDEITKKSAHLVPLVDIRPVRSSSEVSNVSFRAVPFQPPSRVRFTCRSPILSEGIMIEAPLHGEHQLENLATALTTVSALVTNDNPFKEKLLSSLSPTTLINGIENTQWRGRLSFHTIFTPRPLSVLLDGAHNPASARTLVNYINQTTSLSTDSSIDLVYILALSHSPPKTPVETLSPLFPPNLSDVGTRVKLHVALLDFSRPEGMPWVKSVAPSELENVIRDLVPNIDLWVAGQDAQPGTSLPGALGWAKDRIGDAGIVVIAGSLYLVADFYRTFL